MTMGMLNLPLPSWVKYGEKCVCVQTKWPYSQNMFGNIVHGQFPNPVFMQTYTIGGVAYHPVVKEWGISLVEVGNMIMYFFYSLAGVPNFAPVTKLEDEQSLNENVKSPEKV